MSEDAQSAAEGRFFNFIDTVKSTQKVYGLKNAQGGLATWAFDEEEGKGAESVVPFWSDKEAAASNQAENFDGYSVFVISLKDFQGTYLPALAKQNIHVGINFTELMTGIDMPADAFKEKMQE